MGVKSTKGISRSDTALARVVEEANDDLQNQGVHTELGFLYNFAIVDNPKEYNRHICGYDE